MGDSDVMAAFEPIARHYRLIFHERVVARRYYRYRYSTPELRGDPRTADYGPVAVVLMGAYYAWGLPGWLLGMSGIGLLVASGGATYAYVILYIGIAMTVVSVARVAPQASARKRYQADRELQSRRLPPHPPGVGGPDSR